uniref:Uncharacterized protein n=1 Tax=Theileria annulata TaxID=5874 RepID=A0A3B0N5P7_THEAN
MADIGFGIPLQSNLNKFNHDLEDVSKKCVWFSQDDLVPTNLEAIKEILRLEKTPLRYWLLLAFSYKSLGHSESSDSLLKDSETLFANEQGGPLYSSLAYHNLTQAYQFKNEEDRHTKYMDWTNHYARKTEGASMYHFYLLKGHQHLLNFTREKNFEYLSSARTMFQHAINLNNTKIIPVILFGNIMAMCSNYQMASVYYLKALLMTTYYLSMVDNYFKIADESNEIMFELSLARSQLIWLKSLLLFAIASCQFSLGDIESANTLVEKSISVMPMSISYRLLSSINSYKLTHYKDDFDENDPDTQRLFQEYTKTCLLCYNLDKANPLNQLQMCEFLFHKGEVEECAKKLQDLQKLNLPYNLRSELEYQLGRIEHFKENYTEALSHYINAISLKSDFMVARLQLIKVAAGSSDLGLAREHCDFLLQCLHKVPIVLKVSAYVYLCSAREALETNRWEMLKLESVNKSQNQLDISCMFHTVQQGMGRLIDERLLKAVSLLDDLMTMENTNENDEEPFETLRMGNKDKTDFSDPLALEYYIRCLEMLVSRGREYFCPTLKCYYSEYFKLYRNESPQFNNNFGVILMYTRDYAKACKILQDLNEKLLVGSNQTTELNNTNAISSNSSNEDLAKMTMALTVRFNYALALEFTGQFSKANKIYSALTREYPRYTPPWLRKSIMAFKKCDYENSVRYLDQVKRVHPLSCEPYLLRAYHLGRLKSFDEAIHEIRKMFRAIPVSTYDPYANTLLASLLIRKSYKLPQTAGTQQIFPKEAMQYAKIAIKRPSVCNFYAANCIAVLLALNKNLKASYESFLLLLESLSVTSHMKLLVNKNMGLVSAAITLAFMTTDKKFDRNKLNKLKVAKTQQYFQTAISNGKMDKNLYICYIRFLFDVQKYEECISMVETAKLIFQDDVFAYNQVIVTDSMICTYLRDAEKTNSVVEMNNMLSGCRFITSTGDYFLAMNQRGHGFMTPEMCNKLKQILSRIKTKVMPHITSTLPHLEKECENKQKAREKRLQLQLSIQQAQEAKKRQMEEERMKAAEADEALSQQLLKEASEIASEILTGKAPQP